MSSQGANANKNGAIIEQMLFPLFEGNGYEVAVYGKSKVHPRLRSYSSKKDREHLDELDKLVLYQYPYDSIYPGKRGKTEFYVRNRLKNRELRIECKWQQGSGSVDEKMPYLYLNAALSFPEKEIILILDGGGLDKSAKPWLEEQCRNRWLLDDQPEKTIKVMSVSEFVSWFNVELS